MDPTHLQTFFLIHTEPNTYTRCLELKEKQCPNGWAAASKRYSQKHADCTNERQGPNGWAAANGASGILNKHADCTDSVEAHPRATAAASFCTPRCIEAACIGSPPHVPLICLRKTNSAAYVAAAAPHVKGIRLESRAQM